MGDKLLEQAVILSLKYHFFRPMYYSSPIENSFYIVSIHLYLTFKGRAMADLADRHYALFANNQHPMQLEIYDDYNKMLRVAHSEDHQARIAATDDRIQEVMD